MGIFGGKKKIFVSSSCYNLAGDEADRPDYLKSLILGNVIGSRSNASLGDAIRDGYIGGPGMKLRNFYRWAEDNYNDVVGLESSGLAGAPDIDPAIVAAEIPGGGLGSTVSVQMVKTDLADFEVWAEQWIMETYPEEITSAWTADFDDASGQITVSIPGQTPHAFTPSNFHKASLYIYAAYNVISSGDLGAVISEGVVTMAPGDPFPSTAGWTTVSYSSVGTETHGLYTKTVFMGNDGFGRLYSIKKVMAQDQIDAANRSYEITNQEVTSNEWSPLKIFIYRVGSGTSLDSLVTSTSVGGFFPPIPVRIDNQFISESYLPTQYEAASKAYKKLISGAKFDELISKLEDNPDLGDIDYVFVVPGVSLNVKENSCRRYLYEFFAGSMLTSLYGESAYGSWNSGIGTSTGVMAGWEDWYEAQNDTFNPLYGTPDPGFASYGSAPRNEIQVKLTDAALGYDTRIAWKSIKEDTFSGLGKTGATVGEVWLEKGGTVSEAGPSFSGIVGMLASGLTSEDLLIYWQAGANVYKRLTIRGLVHQNYIYKGKYVEITAHEALDDADESGFIIPIHYDTWRAMSLRHTTQMTTACLFLVLNSYQVVKQKWYQTGIFKILLVIATIVLTYFFPPAGLVGASLLTVTVVVLSQIVLSMILFEILNTVAVSIFGKKWGTAIAIIATFIIMTPQALTNPQVLMQPDNLLRLTNAVGSAVTSVAQADVMDTMKKTQGILEDYASQSKEIADLYAQNIGYGRGIIDPMNLTDSVGAAGYTMEPGNVFLTRTLMTGSDIAELANTLLSDFASLTLNTQLPV